jgi:DNA/RNA-binding protein KIN17
MLVVGEHAGKHITNFSTQFQSEFVALLSRRCASFCYFTSVLSSDFASRFGTKRVRANQVYQEYISDKSHLHMNSTRWVTLTEFVKHLGRCGIARVDENEKGWFIAWIDSSPKALAKAVRRIIHCIVLKLTYCVSFPGSIAEEGPRDHLGRAA